jgi:hypothetical protein
VFENRVLKIIFGYKGEETTGCWKKFHNEKLHHLYSSSNINYTSQITENEMSRACSMHEKDAKHILNIILKK